MFKKMYKYFGDHSSWSCTRVLHVLCALYKVLLQFARYVREICTVHTYLQIYWKLKIKVVTKLHSGAGNRTNLSRMYLSIGRIAYRAGSTDISFRRCPLKTSCKMTNLWFPIIHKCQMLFNLTAHTYPWRRPACGVARDKLRRSRTGCPRRKDSSIVDLCRPVRRGSRCALRISRLAEQMYIRCGN